MTGSVERETRVLGLGERAEVRLAGLGAAGYRWSATVDDPTIVKVETVVMDRGPSVLPPGASRDEVFALVALAVGETVVRFVQARSFESGAEPHAMREIGVRVRA